MIEYDFLHEVMPSSWLKGRRTGMKLRMWRCHSGCATDRWWPRNQDRDHDEVTSSRQLFVLKPTSPPLTCVSLYKDRGPRYLSQDEDLGESKIKVLMPFSLLAHPPAVLDITINSSPFILKHSWSHVSAGYALVMDLTMSWVYENFGGYESTILWQRCQLPCNCINWY